MPAQNRLRGSAIVPANSALQFVEDFSGWEAEANLDVAVHLQVGFGLASETTVEASLRLRGHAQSVQDLKELLD